MAIKYSACVSIGEIRRHQATSNDFAWFALYDLLFEKSSSINSVPWRLLLPISWMNPLVHKVHLLLLWGESLFLPIHQEVYDRSVRRHRSLDKLLIQDQKQQIYDSSRYLDTVYTTEKDTDPKDWIFMKSIEFTAKVLLIPKEWVALKFSLLLFVITFKLYFSFYSL